MKQKQLFLCLETKPVLQNAKAKYLVTSANKGYTIGLVITVVK